MIPAGILAQNTRDLSKEIWISWGVGYTNPEQGVYVNTFTRGDLAWTTLKNASGENTDYQISQEEEYNNSGALDLTLSPTGVLDLINRQSLVMTDYSSMGEEFYGYLTIRKISGNDNIDLSILNGRTMYGDGYISGWGLNEVIYADTPAVQTKMEVTEDWITFNSVTTDNGYLAIKAYPSNSYSYSLRAIVIKLL